MAEKQKAALKRKPHWYTRELKRSLLQIMACFSGYTTVTGTQADGTERFLDVPLIYGNMSKLGAFVLRGGSEGTMQYLPVGALNMTSLKRDDSQRRTPYHSEKFNYVERAVNSDGAVVAGVPGKRKTVERFMPVPHLMGFDVCFWCSNEDQRFQLIEQIGALYSTPMDFLLGNSPADWTNLQTISFDGEYKLEPVSLSGDVDKDPYLSVTFPCTASIWIGLPVKVYDTKFIHSIQVPIYELNAEVDWDTMGELDKIVIEASEEDILRFSNLEPKKKKPPQD